MKASLCRFAAIPVAAACWPARFVEGHRFFQPSGIHGEPVFPPWQCHSKDVDENFENGEESCATEITLEYSGSSSCGQGETKLYSHVTHCAHARPLDCNTSNENDRPECQMPRVVWITATHPGNGDVLYEGFVTVGDQLTLRSPSADACLPSKIVLGGWEDYHYDNDHFPLFQLHMETGLRGIRPTSPFGPFLGLDDVCRPVKESVYQNEEE
mmetsp:Transcript_17409/g.33046  ORF Transcript_17409/g.33046 Transcript_17409/m.33046 type:complete len:212 (+) Transcript_17409:931-1566(+)|eukprot:scaffold4286_cov92-Amphora_coffeaeformis.AAC.12